MVSVAIIVAICRKSWREAYANAYTKALAKALTEQATKAPSADTRTAEEQLRRHCEWFTTPEAIPALRSSPRTGR